MAAISTTISPAMVLALWSILSKRPGLCEAFEAWRSPARTLSMMALEEKVAPLTASTFIVTASSTVFPFQLSISREAWAKKSGVSVLGRALMLTTRLSLMAISTGTGPP